MCKPWVARVFRPAPGGPAQYHQAEHVVAELMAQVAKPVEGATCTKVKVSADPLRPLWSPWDRGRPARSTIE